MTSTAEGQPGSRHYDLVIIGSGSGNSILSPEWENRTVALIDSGAIFGGTCLNAGCIPTKMFVYPADLAAGATEAASLGVDAIVQGVRWADIRDRIFTRIDSISQGGEEYRRSGTKGLTLYREEAWFTGTHSLETASGVKITANQVVIAAGSRPYVPDFEGNTLPQVHTSDTVMRLAEQPARVVIDGAGYVGSEFAHIFSALGSQVTMVSRSGRLLPNADAEVSARFAAAAAERWTVRKGYHVTSVTEQPDGSLNVRLTAADQSTLDVPADVLLVATGRTRNTDRIRAAAAGFDVDANGRLHADEQQRALSGGQPVKGVWALGDISTEYMLKHVANHEARVVAHNLLHPDALRTADHRFVPSAVFSRPQVAQVGLTEAAARGAGYDVVSVSQDYGSTAYGWAMEDHEGFVKLVGDRATGALLGAHIMGHEASMLIQPLIQAMSFSLAVEDMARGQYWIHPALTEVVENALLSLVEKLNTVEQPTAAK